MTTPITRRQLIEKALPPKATINVVAAILRTIVIAYLVYLFIVILFGVTTYGWMLFSSIAFVLTILSLLRVRYDQLKQRMKEKNDIGQVAFLAGIETVLTLGVSMTSGVVLFEAWRTRPGEVYVALFFMASCAFASAYDRSRTDASR